MRFRSTAAMALAAALVACRSGAPGSPAPDEPVTPARVEAMAGYLASDAMAGRMTGSPGAAAAATWIAERMREAGIEPAGDSGYFQRVPVARTASGRPVLAADFSARDTFPAERRLEAVNVVGLIPGTDRSLAAEVVLVSAHYDHVGIRQPVAGDSIYNGADDDASGTVAVLEVARRLRHGPPVRRTVVFAAFIGEEVGGVGSRWYLQHPVRALEATVANLNIEMIGRPDSLAGGPGRAWLTGYERSTMGDGLEAAGVPIVPDPRPAQNFFRRSDNYPLAVRGIVAHTLSTFNLHTDYHRPSDEAGRLDYGHMARVIEAAVLAVRVLSDGPRPEWKPGGRPERE